VRQGLQQKSTTTTILTLEQPSASIDANATCYDSSAKYLPQQKFPENLTFPSLVPSYETNVEK